MDKTLTWYEENGQEYADYSCQEDMKYEHKRFTENVPAGSLVLDIGCGSGRDTRFFIENGYSVEAADGSAEMCRIASEYTGIQVRNINFNELNEKDRYNGIWASKCLLHLPFEELKKIFDKLMDAMKIQGFLYMSFKYGTFEGYRDDRYFLDMDIEKSAELILPRKDALLMECWKSHAPKRDGTDQLWLNLIVRKINPETADSMHTEGF